MLIQNLAQPITTAVARLTKKQLVTSRHSSPYLAGVVTFLIQSLSLKMSLVADDDVYGFHSNQKVNYVTVI